MKRHLVEGFVLAGVLIIGLAALTPPAAATSHALPPRPTPVVTATPAPMAGGVIGVRVVDAPSDLWTTVEWQDAAGRWHLVEGWQGTLDTNQIKTWWVAEADRGKGPFRWALYRRRGGARWSTSEPFYLPRDKHPVEIKLTAGPPSRLR
jgi:hypothetical protein